MHKSKITVSRRNIDSPIERWQWRRALNAFLSQQNANRKRTAFAFAKWLGEEQLLVCSICKGKTWIVAVADLKSEVGLTIFSNDEQELRRLGTWDGSKPPCFYCKGAGKLKKQTVDDFYD